MNQWFDQFRSIQHIIIVIVVHFKVVELKFILTHLWRVYWNVHVFGDVSDEYERKIIMKSFCWRVHNYLSEYTHSLSCCISVAWSNFCSWWPPGPFCSWWCPCPCYEKYDQFVLNSELLECLRWGGDCTTWGAWTGGCWYPWAYCACWGCPPKPWAGPGGTPAGGGCWKFGFCYNGELELRGDFYKIDGRISECY